MSCLKKLSTLFFNIEQVHLTREYSKTEYKNAQNFSIIQKHKFKHVKCYVFHKVNITPTHIANTKLFAVYSLTLL